MPCMLTKQHLRSRLSTVVELDQLHEESLIINSSRCDELDVIVLFCIDFCSLSEISRPPWAHSASVCDALLQSTLCANESPCACMGDISHTGRYRSFFTKHACSQQSPRVLYLRHFAESSYR